MTVSRIAIAQNGPVFSRLIFGMWRLADWGITRADLTDRLNLCLELGITTMDTADIYGDYTAEGLFGEALIASPALRGKMQIIAKCGIKLVSRNRPEHKVKHYDTSKAHIIASVENSLKMMRIDHVDLLLIHRPDPLMDADDTAAGLSAVKESGKVLHVGVSNFLPWQYELLASRLAFPLVTNQVEFSVMNTSALHDGTIDQCQRLRVSPMAWSPMAGGRLFRDQSDQAVRLRQALGEVGAELGRASIAQVACAWILSHAARVLPILGSKNMGLIREVAAAEGLRLSRQQWFSILSASTGAEVP